jgi:hypothetical protein
LKEEALDRIKWRNHFGRGCGPVVWQITDEWTKIETHILCSVTPFRKSCRVWDNVEIWGAARQAADDNKIRRMCFACWITKATEYLIFLAFPRQQWLSEGASRLSYTYIAHLVIFSQLCSWVFLSHELRLLVIGSTFFRIRSHPGHGAVFCRNVGNGWPANAVSYLRRIPQLHSCGVSY